VNWRLPKVSNSALFLFATDMYVWPTESFLIEPRQSYWENATYHEFSLRILGNIPYLPSSQRKKR